MASADPLVPPPLEGTLVSMALEPFEEKLDSLSTASFALALKYHVPSAREVVCVNEAVEAVELLTPDTNEESVDHSNIYASVLCKPAPESVEAVHVHSGVLSDVGVVADGVPGVVGTVVSTSTEELAEKPDSLLAASLAFTRAYQVPSARVVVWVKVADVEVAELAAPKLASVSHCTV